MSTQTPDHAMGVSGRIAAFFQSAQITPLLALVALLVGIFAVMVTPREEEPQINVTMANVLIPFPGASARDVEQMVAGPAEQVLGQISGVEHVMSVSRPGLAMRRRGHGGLQRTRAAACGAVVTRSPAISPASTSTWSPWLRPRRTWRSVGLPAASST